MWDWLSKGDNLKGLGSVIGGLGGAYGAIMQSKYAKNLINLQKADYQRGIARQDAADKSLSDAWANSTYAKKKKNPNSGLVAL